MFWIVFGLIIFLLIITNYKKINDNKNIQIIIIITGLILLIIFVFSIKTNNISSIINNINNDNYDVIIIDDFLSNQDCDDLIEYANTQNFITSETMSEYGNVTSDYRKSKQIWISDSDNKIANKISEYCEILLGLPRQNMESLQLVYYDVSGYFKEHYDAEPDKTKKSNIIDRAHTFIVYLNDVEDGGGTELLNLNLKVQPKKGMALYFKTLTSEGDLLKKSLHQGLPIIRGEKYIINKWIHLNEFKK